jgi:hypothetical protein
MSSAAVAIPARAPRVTQVRVLLSEWTKLRSLRSTRYSLLIATVLTVGFSLLFAAITANRWSHMSPAEQAGRNPMEIALAGVNFSQLAIGVLGILVISGEYATGMIRATMTAVPRRLPVLWAKTAVFAVVTFVLMVPSVLLGFWGSQAILNRHHILQISFSAPGVARAVIGAALYLTVIGVFALALGAIIRSTAGGISAFAGILFVLPPLMSVLPASWNDAISPYLPSNAGRAILSISQDSGSLAPWTGLGLFAAYALVGIAIAAFLLVRRDA